MESKQFIAVIGLGYVGLPLAVEFAKKYPVVGFDINPIRVKELMNGHDHTLEIEDDNLKKVLTETRCNGLFCTIKMMISFPATIISLRFPHPRTNTIIRILLLFIKPAKP